MLQTPKGLRLHIGLFGKRNAGKSSLINALTSQTVSIVSGIPGTTTDAVEKSFELAGIGPVVFIDTAGIDDVGELGHARVERTRAILQWIDLAVIVCTADTFDNTVVDLIEYTRKLGTPAILVFNKCDSVPVDIREIDELKTRFNIPVESTNTISSEKITSLRKAIVRLLSEHIPEDRLLVGDLLSEGDTALLVTPIDSGAPKGRLILPQVQAIREILDAHAKCYIVQQNRVKEAISDLNKPPKVIIADSQVILEVAAQTPTEIPLTTFSIQMAYAKADVIEMARGAAALASLEDGDRILILETCSHHPQKDDIGRVKIPRWLKEKTGKQLKIDFCIGKDIPADLTPYKVLIQCGGCIVTRHHMLARLRAAKLQGVPMTNYGMTISYLQGVLERVLLCHPQALKAYRDSLSA